MPLQKKLHLPAYQSFSESIDVLNLACSASMLHGIMCGYLCAGAASEGEAYLRALMGTQKDEAHRNAALAMFHVYTISEEQIKNMDFEFQLLLPHEDDQLPERAQAFGEWCEGFLQGLTFNGIQIERLREEEARDVLQHLEDFAELDYDALEINEDDERALMEVSEYTRMAVLHLHSDIMSDERKANDTGTAH